MTTTATTNRYVADEITADIATAAYTIYRRYKKWITFPELLGVVSQWVTDHPQVVIESRRRITAILRDVAELRARKVKADKLGYKTDDEYFYSLRTIIRMLPYALDPGATPPSGVEEESSEINRHHSGREGYGGWETALADIRRALSTLPRRQQAILTVAYLGGVTTRWLANRLGLTTEATLRELKSILRTLQRRLGGKRPSVPTEYR